VKSLIVVSIAALTVAAAFGVAGAGAKDRAEVRAAGSCTGRSTAKLKLSPDNGRIETEFEVDQNRVGQHWQVVLRRNGRVAARATRRTTAPSGSFELRRRLADGAGRDRIVARATNPGTGERCTASASL
jgi:hypothetical protein